jgi:hypothetical protein
MKNTFHGNEKCVTVHNKCVTVHNKCSKIPPSTAVHFANRVRGSCVV